MIEIEQALTEKDHLVAASLMNEFLSVQRVRYEGVSNLISGYFEQETWDNELKSLHKKYAPPKGLILLGYVDGAVRGVVAVHKIDEGICEMKRLFVQEEAQGSGLGKMLCRTLISRAKELGYKKMRLDTGFCSWKHRGSIANWDFARLNNTCLIQKTSHTTLFIWSWTYSWLPDP